MKYILSSILLLLFIKAQSRDTLSTLIPDSTHISDSLSVPDSTNSEGDIDDIIFTTASDSVTFSVPEKIMKIYGKGDIKYKKTQLSSGKISVDFNTNMLNAVGVVDTSDTSKTGFKDTPVMVEDGEKYEGKDLKYNFKNRRGFISNAKNKKEDSRYEGVKVKKVDEDTFFIENGIFTPCDADTPHTHFGALQMKLINKDKVFAKWVFMYIAGVPLPLPIPFGVFPLSSGRSSGIMIPTYTVQNNIGHGFRDFGFYWAISDYMDLKLSSDYFTRGRFGLNSNFRYKKRYDFDGYFNASYYRNWSNESNDHDHTSSTDWSLSWRHSQVLSPTSNFSADVRFASSNFQRNATYNGYDPLTQQISSNASYYKRWDGSSISINYSRSQNLSDNSVSETLPNISYNVSTFYPFARDGNISKNEKKWYELISVGYNSRFTNKRNKKDGSLNIKGGIQHNFSIAATPPKAGYISISPRISYRERWYNKRTVKEEYIKDITTDSTGTPVDTNYALNTYNTDKISMVRDFDFSLSANTKLYGMMNVNNFGIEAIRHTVTPSISYVYSPDFSTNTWGYYDTYTNHEGEEIKYSKYEGQVFGGPSANENQKINFRLNNIWEMKTLKDPNDTTSQAQKITLLNLDASTNYNFTADRNRLSDLNISYRTAIGDLLNISGRNTFTFYDYDGSQKTNVFLKDVGKGLMRMTNFSLDISTSISGDKLAGDDKNDEENISDNDVVLNDNYSNENNFYEDENPDFEIPWNLSIAYNFNLNQLDVTNKTRRSNARFSGSVNLTPKWKIQFSSSYDFIKKEMVAPRISVYRDLHCWEMNFSWTPIGIYRGFNFEIRMKPPQFRDIKLTQEKRIYGL